MATFLDSAREALRLADAILRPPQPQKRAPGEDRDAAIIAMRLGPPPKTLREIAVAFGLHQPRVCQIIHEADVDAKTRARLDQIGYAPKPVNAARIEHAARVVAMRIGPPPMTLEAVGKRLGVTRERVRQILRDAEVDAEMRAKLDAAVGSPETARRAPIIAARAERKLSKMSMVRINRRLHEQHGEHWCSGCKQTVPISGMTKRYDGNGGCSSRCKACAVKDSSVTYKTRRDAGLCVYCGKRKGDPICPKCYPKYLASARKSGAKYTARKRQEYEDELVLRFQKGAR